MTAPDERAALAPCPFCGGMAELRQTRSKVWPMVAVQCAECLALVEAYNDADATAAWERRPPPPPAPAERERLACEEQARKIVEEWLDIIDHHHLNLRFEASEALQQIIAAALRALPASGVEEPVPMILHCPTCGLQHVDAPEPEKGWMNPPHKSHLCHGCGCVWRPTDIETNGVAIIATHGKADTWRPTCPVCGGDCGSANPPVTSCPMRPAAPPPGGRANS